MKDTCAANGFPIEAVSGLLEWENFLISRRVHVLDRNDRRRCQSVFPFFFFYKYTPII